MESTPAPKNDEDERQCQVERVDLVRWLPHGNVVGVHLPLLHESDIENHEDDEQRAHYGDKKPEDQLKSLLQALARWQRMLLCGWHSLCSSTRFRSWAFGFLGALSSPRAWMTKFRATHTLRTRGQVLLRTELTDRVMLSFSVTVYRGGTGYKPSSNCLPSRCT